jgi:molecular chaperone HscB
LDQSSLDARFRELQREVHPDRFAAADDAARRASMMLATQINEGYQTLRSPLKRATYLLSLLGVDVGAESNTAMSPAFLMLQMEWREQVADARADKDLVALKSLETNVGEAIRSVYAELSERLDRLTSVSDTPPAVEAVRQLMFLEKLYEEIDNAIFDLEDL